MKKLIEKQFIQGESLGKPYHTTLENINYEKIHWGFRQHSHSDDCFQEKEIVLTQYITDSFYTGDHLFYYPELAKQIRKLDVYPKFSKKYPLDDDKIGIAFLAYLAEYSASCLNAFKAEALAKYKNFNNLLQLYGYDRYLPLIQQLEEEKEEYRSYCHQTLTINGLKWRVDDFGSKSIIESIRLRELLNISRHYQYVIVNKIIPNTPFLALQCCTHEYNKGHVFWYDLSTLAKTSKADALAWKRPTW